MPGVQVLLLSGLRDERAANVVARHLSAAGLEYRLQDAESVAGDPDVVRSAGAVAVLVGRIPDVAPFRRAADLIGPEQRAYLVLLEGAPPDKVAELQGVFPPDAVIDLTRGLDEAVLADLARRVRDDLQPLDDAGHSADELSEAPASASSSSDESPAQTAPPPTAEPASSAPFQAATKQAVQPEAPPRPPPTRSAATKTAPQLTIESEEASGPARVLDPVIFERMSPSSKQALAEADRLSKLAGSTRIHMDHLLVGLYRKSGGPMQHLLERADPPMSADDLADLVEDVVEAVLPPDGAPAPRLASSPPVSNHAKLAIEEAVRIADARALPDGGPRPIQSRHLLYGALSVRDCALIETLNERGIRREDIDLTDARQQPQPQADDTAAIAGFKSDEAKGRDLLDIRREVEALAKVIAAKDVQPPLAIGLFGDWGTGKTFFMRQMKQRIDEIAEAERSRTDKGPQVYRTEIVQLDFNAWHYIEQDLWASLASAIFDGLDDALTRQGVAVETQERTDFNRAQLLTNRAKALEALERAEKEKSDADANLLAASTRLERLDTMYDEVARGIRPREIVSRAVTVALAEPEVAKQVEGISKRVNETVEAAATTLGVSTENLRDEFARSGSLGGWLTGATRQAFKGSRVWVPIAVAVLGLLLFVVVASYLTAGSTVVAAIAGGVGLVVGALTPAALAAARVWNVIRSARAEGLKAIEQEREQRRQILVAEQQREASRSLDAEGRVDQARTQLKEADTKLEANKPKRMLANFVSGRRASADYRARLGVVAQARGDFEQLSSLLKLAGDDRANGVRPAAPAVDGAKAAGAEDEFLPTIDRIVLYIDDLDRCREKDVVAVLQAVNLLLAFPLFVVVVAVDPRWLVHSLRVESRAFEGAKARKGTADDIIDTEAEAEWQATPLNYLEKIFQVPFAIKPMGEGGFQKMIGDLVRPGETSGTGLQTPEQPTVPRQDPARDQVPRPDTPPATPPTTPPAQEIQPPAPSPEPADIPAPPPPVDFEGGFLKITGFEEAFMATLHPLVTTPRAAKRFVNVYRILKASAPADRRRKMGELEEYRAILLLLAMLTGNPSETTVVLRALIEDNPKGDWWKLVEGIVAKGIDPKAKSVDARLRSDRWKQLRSRLAEVKEEYGAADCAPFAYWVRDVARFSFESSRVLVGQPERPVGRRETGEPGAPATETGGTANTP